jgi:leucine-zipper of insertion element IS481
LITLELSGRCGRYSCMKHASGQRDTSTVARRALLVQRVLVDGWTSAKAAATFGVSERLVNAWVADYRRHGMTSLRRPPRKTVAFEIVQLTIGRPIRGCARMVANRLRRLVVRDRPSQPLPLRRSNDDRRGGE